MFQAVVSSRKSVGGVYVSWGGTVVKSLYLENVIKMARQLYFIVILIVPGIWEGLLWLASPGGSASSVAARVCLESCMQRNAPLDSRNWDVVTHRTEESA